MPADIFVYAIIAVGLIVWLRNILGTRHGEERERSNPLVPPSRTGRIDKIIEGQVLPSTHDAEASNALLGLPQPFADHPAAQEGLRTIAEADRDFDIKHFIVGAQDAFVMIVEAFAQGDRNTLKDLLAPTVYDSFDHAIKEREARGETQKSEIHAFRKTEVVEAKLNGRMALITVKFIAEQTAVTRDAQGTIKDGHPDRTHEMRDIWTFSRDIRSRDPRWLLTATRGDFEGDNAILPNTNS